MKKFARMAIAVMALVSVPVLAGNDSPLCEGEPQTFEQWFYQVFYC
jgi:hypothetical protein